MRKRKADKGLRDNILMAEAHRHFADEFAPACEDHRAAANQIKLRIITQASNLPSQALRKADVVGIHPGDELTFAEGNRLVETSRKPGGAGFPNDTNALVMKTLDNRAALI